MGKAVLHNMSIMCNCERPSVRMVLFRPKKNIRVSTNMPKKVRVGRSEIFFIFCLSFVC